MIDDANCPVNIKFGEFTKTVTERFDRLEELRVTHLDQFHTVLPPEETEQLVTEHSHLMSDTALLVELVAGKQKTDPFTDLPTGEREPGIAERVELLEHHTNGGRGLSIRTRDKLIIVVANGLIAVIVGILAVLAGST